MPSYELPELDTERVSAAYQRSVQDVAPDQVPLAMRLLARLEPKRWTLEWYLPWWLGQAFGLDREIANDLVLGNVFGLAWIRLQDDLVDGDLDAADEEPSRALSSTLYELALGPYRARFAASSPFWSYHRSRMSEWSAATQSAAPPSVAGKNDPDERGAHLSARGAPLKICAFAVCLLTGRIDAYPVLDRALDHALTGLVLYDHFGDWQADLATGRWNALVATLSEFPQEPEFRDRNHAQVLVAMMTQDAIATYFARITMETTSSAALVATLGPGPLVAHLRQSAAMTAEQGSALQAHFRDQGDRAGRLLLDGSIGGRSQDGRVAAAVLNTN